jgi:hypothetical protein
MFVPASTTTISVAINGTTPQTFPCSGSTCSGTFSSPAGGSVNFAFAALDAQQRALSKASFSEAINANGANALNVTLEGVVDHASLAFSEPGLVSYQSGSATVTASAFDVDNDLISGTYFAPLTVSVSGDATGTITVPSATIASSTSTATVAYTFSATRTAVLSKEDITEHGQARRRRSAGCRLKLPSILFADQRRRVSAQSAVRGLAMFVPHWQMVDRCVHVAVLERALDSVPVPEIARVTRVHDLVSLHALEATPQMLAASAHDRLPRRSSSLNARLHVSRRASLRLRAS